ncbi:MAG: hypothetical protein ACE5FS_06300 [Paracoccaceae bacterium]
MKADDRTMTVATGLVLTIGIGFLAQNSGAIMSALSGVEAVAVADDRFTVRAGKPQALDVLANDPAAPRSEEFRIVRQPVCGALERTGNSLSYAASGQCSGPVFFSYCIVVDGNCETAGVTLNVVAAPAKPRKDAVAAAVAPAPAEQPSAKPAAPRSLETLRSSVLTALQKPPEDAAAAALEREMPGVEDLPPEPVASGETLPRPTGAPKPPRHDEGGGDRLAAMLPGQALPREGAELPAERDLPATAPVWADTEVPGSEEAGVIAAVTDDAAPMAQIDTQAHVILPSVQTPAARAGMPAPTMPPATPERQTDKIFVAAIDEAQRNPAGLTASSVELTGAGRPLLPVVPVETATGADPCPVGLEAVSSSGATLRIAIDAPCHQGESFTLEHASIRFAARTDTEGRAILEFPALAEKAEIGLKFASGGSRRVTVTVPDLDRYIRLAVSWEGPADIDLHAFEFGADAGEIGHVWSGAPRGYREARKSGGGYISVLGSGGKGPQAEIYTLPLFRRADSGLVEMSLALNGAAGCGEAVPIRVVRAHARAYMAVRNLRLEVADCGGRSEPVFIANALGDLRVASRQ